MPTGYDLTDTGITVKNGGNITVQSGGTLHVESGGAVKYAGTQDTANAAEKNTLDGTATSWPTLLFGSPTLTPGGETADVNNVAVQLKDSQGNNIAYSALVTCYLSDDSGGVGICATAPSGGVAIGTNGTIIHTYEADKMWEVQTETDGTFDLDVTEAGADTFYLVVKLNNKAFVSSAISFT